MSVTVAISYVRFSSTAQAEGDSLRRQTEAAAAYCKRRGWKLDTELSLRDLGVSAFRGSNAAVGNFRTFLDAVKNSRVKPGSVLIVESFDRISRQGIDEGYDLIKGILKAGVNIVTLSPEREFDVSATKSLSKGALEIQLILERAAEESEIKSKRVSAARERGRERARRGEVIHKKVPSWLHVGDDRKIRPDANKVKVVKRIAKLACDGLGLTAIAARLNKEGVPLLGAAEVRGRKVVWSAGGLHKLLTSRALLGEYQPHIGAGWKRKPVGAVVPDYYPQVMTPEEFTAVAKSMRARLRVGRGRPGRHVNLFAGLLRAAHGGGTFTARFVKGREPVLVSNSGLHGRGERWSAFPLKALESAVLGFLSEVRVEELQPDAPATPRPVVLRERLAELDELAALWRAKMDRPELVDVVADKLAEIRAERKATETRLAEAEADTGDSLFNALGEVRTIAAALAKDGSEDNRIRCRAALRRAVDSVWCLFSNGRGVRWACVQIYFRGGGQREYLILHKRGGRNAQGDWPSVTKGASFVEPVIPGASLDLRNRGHIAPLEKYLNSIKATVVTG